MVRQINWATIKDRLARYVQTDGSRIKNDLMKDLGFVVKHEGWKHFEDPATGKPFENVGVFLQTRFPPGVGCGQCNGMLTYDQVLGFCDEGIDKSLYNLLLKYAPPKAKAGRKKKGEVIGAARHQLQRHGTHRRNVLGVRLAEEKPAFFDAYQRGEYKSIRAAAEAAGLVKPGHDPLARTKSYYRKMTPEQRSEFHAWLKTKEAKSLPRA